MTYKVEQTRQFAKQYKKFHDNIVVDVDDAVDVIAEKPAVGELKKGDLAGLRVYKFHSQGQLYLLGYTLNDAVQLVYLESVASHENFYRNLKR